jgi:ketosteroid isomerase-like protein
VVTDRFDYDFGPQSSSAIERSADPGRAGAVAAVETFYFALNHRDLRTLAAVWADDGLVQLNNPIGGILRSKPSVEDLYRRIFASDIGLQVTFTDAVSYAGADTVVFAGRELASYFHVRDCGASEVREEVAVTIRTTRVFGYSSKAGRWLQLHHHGSIDSPTALQRYRDAVQAGNRVGTPDDNSTGSS